MSNLTKLVREEMWYLCNDEDDWLDLAGPHVEVFPEFPCAVLVVDGALVTCPLDICAAVVDAAGYEVGVEFLLEEGDGEEGGGLH